MIDSNAGALTMKPNLILLRVLQGFDGLTHHIIHGRARVRALRYVLEALIYALTKVAATLWINV
jgi:hypothetical protein